MSCKCFTVVTCKIKHQNIFANVLQMFYFTCNHGLILWAYVGNIRILLRQNSEHNAVEQEAQLPLRNRAPAKHFFVAKLLSIAVKTYTYVYHLRKLRLKIG